MKSTKKLGIVIPIYNESKTILNVLEDIKNLDYLNEKFEDFEILVVDDGSDDSSGSILKNADWISVVSHGYNMGVGAAVRSGLQYFEKKNFDFVIKIDGDHQHSVDEIKYLLDPILNNESDLIYGDRFNGNINYKMPRHRILGNKFFTFILKKLTKYEITDSQPGFFAGNKNFLNNFYILTNYNYTQQIIYSSYIAGLRFKQVPISFNERVSGESFVKYSYPFKAILQILLMIVLKKPLAIFGNMGLILITSSLVISISQLINFLNNQTSKPVENVNLVLGLGITGLIFLITGVILKSIQNLEEVKRKNII